LTPQTDPASALYGFTNAEVMTVTLSQTTNDLMTVIVWSVFTLIAVYVTYLLLTRVIFKWVNYLFKFRL